MQHTSHVNTTSPAACAWHALDLALRRYERMAVPPRHLQIPVVCDLDRVVRSARRAAIRGQRADAEEMFGWCDREWARQKKLAAWPGRSRAAWTALRDRLEHALDWAARTGALTPAGRLLAADRLQAIAQEIRCHDVNDALARLN